MRILIVEDDRKLAHQLKKGLEEQNNSVTIAHEGHEGFEAAQHGGFDVLVIDVMLPGMDGFAIVRKLRAQRVSAPILMLTARDTTEDIVEGLDAGADDYLTKPFSFKVLVARLRALARRRTVEPSEQLRVADLVLDPASRRIWRAGASVSLTRTQYLLLEALMRSSGRVITRSRLIEYAWGFDRDVESNTLDVSIRGLRMKIDPPGGRRLIHTVRGVGFVMREEEE